ncbi:aquaporin, Major intrinsic protein family [Ceratobasidium sp. AG-Ba]|nr:aquaporin, Major intrinsic protein family [Ceratobasidium sp. AG-Ba]
MRPDSRSLFGNFRADVEAAVLEFIGTTLWLLFALGGIQSSIWTNQDSISTATNGHVRPIPSSQQVVHAAAAFGLSLLVAMWLFYRATGGVFNPNVSLALLLVGVIGPVRFVLFFVAQVLGAIAASAILLGLLPGPLVVTPAPGNGINVVQALFIEAFMTTMLVLAVLMLAAEKHKGTPFAPIGVGLTVFAGMLWGDIYTGCAMNTARAFGPAVFSGFDGRHWVYWVGPFLGSLMATALYVILKHIRYWDLNPDQDSQDPKQSPMSNGSSKTENGNGRAAAA